MNSNKQNLINKIIYRSQYRGTKEMDIFVSGFVKSIIDSLSIDDLRDLDKLVNMNDEDISKISKNEMSFENNKLSISVSSAVSILDIGKCHNRSKIVKIFFLLNELNVFLPTPLIVLMGDNKYSKLLIKYIYMDISNDFK